MYKYIILTILILFGLLHLYPVKAQSEQTGEISKELTFEATVISILEEKEIEIMGKKQQYQKLKLRVSNGPQRTGQIIVENGDLPVANNQLYKVNDDVIVTKTIDIEGKATYYISDYVRRDAIYRLFIIFILFTIGIARWRGILSLIGMVISFFVIFKFILPRISAGANPVETVIIGSILIIPVSFFLSHGFNKKTTVAIIGTLISLVITGILSDIFVEAAKLTGFASEEAGFLQIVKQGAFNMKGLLLAGIIIGVLGVLDDITISQSAIVFQLKKANETLSTFELFKRAMNVGQDHIASMVNTLILVYTGAALPLLLLFVDSSRSFSEIINYEIIADEIIRTLVGSIGLILAVPVTTVLASVVAHQRAGS